MDYNEMGHSHFYFLTFNNWSEPVPCDEIFCVTKDKVKYQTYLDFYCKLAWELIDNAILKQQEAAVEDRRMMLCSNHKHLNGPTHTRCFKNRNGIAPTNNHTSNTNAGQWIDTKNWNCSCSIGEWMCKDCYSQHMVEVTKQFAEDDNLFITLKLELFRVYLSLIFGTW